MIKGNKTKRLLLGLTLGLSIGYGCNVHNSWSMTDFKFHGILQANGLVKTIDLHGLTVLQAKTYASYLASMYQLNHNKNALSALRILGEIHKFSSLRSEIKIMVSALSQRLTPKKITPIKKTTGTNQAPNTGGNASGTSSQAQKTRLVLNIDYFYGVLRANKLLPNKEIVSLDDDELKTYIDYLLLKRKYDSTNQAVIEALKVILALPRYKQFIGSKEEIFLYPKKTTTTTSNRYGTRGFSDQKFYAFLKNGDIIDMATIKKLNSEQLDIYIDYLKLRYKYFRIEDGDQMDNQRTTSAEKYLHKVLLIRSRKRTPH